LAYGFPEFVDGSHGYGAQVRFEFGEGLDGIEVRAVGRQEEQPSASLADGLFGSGTFVRGQVVQNDDVALLQCRGELGAHVGLEDRAVHRGVDDPRRSQRSAAQSCDEGLGLGLPVAKRGLGAATAGEKAFRATLDPLSRPFFSPYLLTSGTKRTGRAFLAL
jgi:hypothetical protein